MIAFSLQFSVKMNKALIDFTSVNEFCTIVATVPTGLESVALEEIAEKLKYECVAAQGKVYFQATVDCLDQLHNLRSVDRLFLMIKQFQNYHYHEEKPRAIQDLKELAPSLPWTEVVKFWKENCKYQKTLSKNRSTNNDRKEKAKPCDENINHKNSSDLIRFRASANRIGKKQSITSPDAEWHFGGAVQDFTSWKVDLSNYNFEILLTLGTDSVMIGLSLTHESLHRRNIVNFGYTTLRASIAHNMLRMCDIKLGDVVLDPMCGSGSIPIEAAQEWSTAYHLAGDNSLVAVNKSLANVKHMNQLLKANYDGNAIKTPIDIFRWDVKALPLKSETIDVFVTDLPFGKRLGSKMDNRSLYPSMVMEMARVCRRCTGRACLLTNDKRSILNSISAAAKFWNLKKTYNVNVGGLRAAVYLLNRTAQVVQHC